MCKAICFTGDFMFEKNLEMSLLLDFYGETLSERKRAVMSLYYNEDLSLAEIADEFGISRQGVRELIKKSESELTELECKLGLVARFESLRQLAEDVESRLESCDTPLPLREAILRLTAAAKK